jgi:hypothetical protein
MSAGTVNVKVRTSPQKQTLLWPGAGSWSRAVECCIQGLRAEGQRINTLNKQNTLNYLKTLQEKSAYGGEFSLANS